MGDYLASIKVNCATGYLIPYKLLKSIFSSLCSWSVQVFLKDSIFEASSHTRHITELARLLKKMFPNTTAVVMYMDGGPDNNCKCTSVRLGMLALFWNLTWTP